MTTTTTNKVNLNNVAKRIREARSTEELQRLLAVCNDRYQSEKSEAKADKWLAYAEEVENELSATKRAEAAVDAMDEYEAEREAKQQSAEPVAKQQSAEPMVTLTQSALQDIIAKAVAAAMSTNAKPKADEAAEAAAKAEAERKAKADAELLKLHKSYETKRAALISEERAAMAEVLAKYGMKNSDTYVSAALTEAKENSGKAYAKAAKAKQRGKVDKAEQAEKVRAFAKAFGFDCHEYTNDYGGRFAAAAKLGVFGIAKSNEKAKATAKELGLRWDRAFGCWAMTISTLAQ